MSYVFGQAGAEPPDNQSRGDTSQDEKQVP